MRVDSVEPASRRGQAAGPRLRRIAPSKVALRQACICVYLRHYHGTNVSGERQRPGTLVAWSTSGAGPRAKPKAPAVGHFSAPGSFLARGIPSRSPAEGSVPPPCCGACHTRSTETLTQGQRRHERISDAIARPFAPHDAGFSYRLTAPPFLLWRVHELSKESHGLEVGALAAAVADAPVGRPRLNLEYPGKGRWHVLPPLRHAVAVVNNRRAVACRVGAHQL